MPAKLLNTFADENPDLKKQIGCITGIFQMFDRRHFLTGRRLNDHYHKKLPSDHALLSIGRQDSEQNTCFSQILQEKNLSKNLNENQTVSMESSRASFSSSSSSSFSSLEFNKSSQQEACSFDRTFFPEKSPKNSPKFKNPEHGAKSKSGRQSLDFQNVVKVPMQKYTEDFTIKTSSNEKVKNHALKHKDSPRPVLFNKARMPADLNEAIRVLVELKKAPWNFSEPEAKDTSFYQQSQRTPRFSCDGREFSRLPMDSKDNSKSASKLRELPRLSLDSRQGSLRNSNIVSQTSLTLEDLDKTNTTPRVNRAANLLQDLSQGRHPSIVAKLMGLDEMPDLNSAAQETATRRSIPFHEPRDCTSGPKGSRDEKSDQFPHSIQSRDPTMTKPKNPHSLLKHNSWIMTEAAPWTQQDQGHTPHKTKAWHQEARMKQQTESLYKEIEERLKGIQFKQQNKDLKSLKQTVDSMRAKRLAQTTKDAAQTYKTPILEDYLDRTPTGRNQNSRSPKVLRQPAKADDAPKSFDSPIVIMKPAKTVNISDASAHSLIPLEGLSTLPKLHTSSAGSKKSSANNTTEKDHSPRVRLGETNTQALLSTEKQFIRRSTGNSSSPRSHSNSTQSLSKLQKSPGENNGISTRTSTTQSPRLQQKKIQVEKKSYPPTPELNKAQSQSTNRNPVESISPRGKLRLKPSQLHKNKDQVDESIFAMRGSGYLNNEISPGFNKNRSLALQSAVLQQCLQSPSSRAAQNAALVMHQKNSSLNMNRHKADKELASIAFEQPSPVSVLDASCYQEEFLLSPVKGTNTIRNHTPCTLDICCYPKKLQDLENHVQLKLLSSNDELITSKCNMQNSDHKFVAEILLATGFLNKDCPLPLHLHSSVHAFNPDLFGVLEQPKHGWLSKLQPDREDTHHRRLNVEKNHRKLVFDVVNEILAHKMELIAHENRPDLLLQTRRRKLSGQHLLEEVCSEIERIRAENKSSTSLEDDGDFITGEDVLPRSEERVEKSKVALQIERLIFKDLINELVSDAARAL